MNVLERGDFHWVDELVVADFRQKYFRQVLLELDSTFYDVYEWFDRLTRVTSDIFIHIDLGMKDSKGDL